MLVHTQEDLCALHGLDITKEPHDGFGQKHGWLYVAQERSDTRVLTLTPFRVCVEQQQYYFTS